MRSGVFRKGWSRIVYVGSGNSNTAEEGPALALWACPSFLRRLLPLYRIGKAALAVERQSAGVINVVAVRKADAKTPFAKEVKRLLVSQEFKDKIAHSKFADFGKPTTW